MQHRPTRRQFLSAMTAGSVVALAGCDGGDGTGEPAPTDEPTATPTPEPMHVEVARPTSYSFEMELTRPLDSGDVVLDAEGYVDGDEWHRDELERFPDGDDLEWTYVYVDGTRYSVDHFGECETYSFGAGRDELPIMYEEGATLIEALPVTETATFDGADAHAVAFTPEQAREHWGGHPLSEDAYFAGTYYVAVESGRIVGGEWEMHDEAEPYEGSFRLSDFGEDVAVEVPDAC